MPLRFDLAAFDRLYIGKSVIMNSHERAYFFVEGKQPILRSKHYLAPSAADTWLEKLYCCIQQMYLEEAAEKYEGSYLELRVHALEEAPSLYLEIMAADELIKAGNYYKALRNLKKFIRYQAFQVERVPPERYVPRVAIRKR